MKREDFSILNEQVHGRKLVYLDNAATSQKPQEVIDAIVEGYTHFNANIHRGVHYLSQVATEHHEQAREKVAQFIGAREKEEIIFTKGTTDSVNMLAYALGEGLLKEGDEVVVSSVEHHSNLVPWQMVCERKGARLRVVPLTKDLRFDIEAYKALLNERTRVVSVAHVSNVLGTKNPVDEIIGLAHRVGAVVCVDGAQSVPHMRVDVRKMDCDFLAFSAHKMYGPTGLGVLYGKREWLDKLPPVEGGGEMIEHVRFEKSSYNSLPYKYEAGTPNFIGSYAFSKALDYMERIGMGEIARYESELTAYAEKRMGEIEGIVIYAKGQEKSGVVSFNVDGVHPYDLGMLLDQQGVAIRTGHHCAEPLINLLGATGTARVSFGLYNDQEDVDAFVDALKRAVAMLR